MAASGDARVLCALAPAMSRTVDSRVTTKGQINVPGPTSPAGVHVHIGALEFGRLSGASMGGGEIAIATASRVAAGGGPAPTVSEKYEVLDQVGAGGMGAVFRVRHLGLDAVLAMKILAPELASDPELNTRFRREAQVMARLHHRNIIRVLDFAHTDEASYLVMEFVRGKNLLEYVRDRMEVVGAPLPLDEVLRIGREIAEALAYAHAAAPPVIHRDIKPSNIMIEEPSGRVVVTDFGIAKLLDERSSPLTRVGEFVGTIRYCAPEQLRRCADVDGRADVYGLGVVLYFLATGAHFHAERSDEEVIGHVLYGPDPDAAALAAVPGDLAEIIARAIARDCTSRFPTARALLARLEACSRGGARSGDDVRPGWCQRRGMRRRSTPSWLVAPERTALVGRTPELATLRAAWERARAGRQQGVFVVGEPGIGKTRLVVELARAVYAEPATVLIGRCSEVLLAAYQPFVEALRQYVAECSEQLLRAQLGSVAGELQRLVPELVDRVPGSSRPRCGQSGQRYDLFEAVARWLVAASETAPVLLVLEDLQWGDASTLLLLEHLASTPRAAALLVVATYREGDVGPRHPLAATLAAVRRAQPFDRVALEGFSESESKDFIDALAGHDAPRGFTRVIHAQTDGNPFFIREVLRHLMETGVIYRDADRWVLGRTPSEIGVPQGLKEVIPQRLARLSDPCIRVLRVAAVVGREFDLAILERVGGRRGPALLDALEEAIDARIIAEVPLTVGRYSFVHALIREILYGQLTTLRCVRLHSRIGRAVEAVAEPDVEGRLAELAYHFTAALPAGNVAKALDYATRAGAQAMTALAYEDAAVHFERALRAAEICTPPDEARQYELLVALGAAQVRAGFPAGVHEQTSRRAVDLARRLKARS